MGTQRIFHWLLMLFLGSVLFSSCTLETSDNGDLDGFWHLCQVDTLSSGGTCDMTEELIFWSVQVDLLNTVDRNGIHGSYFFYFENKDNTLRLYRPCTDDRMNSDPEVTSAEVLQPFGVNAIDETFCIETLTNSHMVLRSDKLKLTFRKM